MLQYVVEFDKRAPVPSEAPSHAVLGAELERAARQQSDCECVRNDHDDEWTKERRQ